MAHRPRPARNANPAATLNTQGEGSTLNNIHLLTAAALTALSPVAAAFLCGYLTLLLLGLDAGSVEFGTYYRYLGNIDHPQVQPFAWRIKTAGAIGCGLVLLTWASLLVILFKLRSDGNIHGRARFARMVDLMRTGFLKHRDDGIVVGQTRGKLLRLSGQQFAILAAPTRSGKGVGVVIPNLLDYRESVVVLDIKQENFDLTSGWRRSIGHEVFLFNPFAEDRRSHRWNPMTYVSHDPALRVSDLQAIAAMLYPDGDDKDRFWTSQARNAFLGFALYLFERADADAGAPRPTLGEVLRLASGDGTELKAYIQKLTEAPFLGGQARTAFSGLLSQADVTFASIIGTFREPLNAWLNPILDAATSADDCRLEDVRRRRMTIYVGIQPNKLAESRLIVNLFFSQLINVNTRTLPQNDPSLRHQCLLLMDEFTSIGRVDIIAKAVAYMAGYNLRLLPIIQSMAQLDAVYGKELSRTLITNHALQIIYAPREQQDANDYSEMLGYTTIRRRARTRSHGQGRSVSDNEVLEKRALMLPQELKAMGPEKEIVIYEGLAHPVLCRKIRYYRDRYFTGRLMAKVEVKPLDLERIHPRTEFVQSRSHPAPFSPAAAD
uniref:Type IV secretory system conjugative DNA transfer family protein n=1 Tax=Coralloluteibacterium stylophorae TaxID=1776034 RepID=A0A8J8AZZ1_9GAMM